MMRVFDLLDRVTRSALPVVIHGETGTGKELVAKAVHEGSPRRGRTFISINCAAIPENLLESELFGYVKGAFTGALKDSKGLFEVAHGGTLFLDEIGEMSMGLQAKLLRVIQEREVRPIGGKRSISVDVRIVCATNKDLRELVASGSFREDLFFRLNVLELSLPPLRERREDIPILAAHFLEAFLAGEGGDAKALALSESALGILSAYDWPGNVRELKNTVERAAVFAKSQTISAGEIENQIRSAPEGAPSSPDDRDYRESKALFEKEFLESALRRTGGNVSRAARDANLERAYFHRLMKKYDIRAADFK
jgi:transcriptional regulator with GAF, ATPase, and Fis domain